MIAAQRFGALLTRPTDLSEQTAVLAAAAAAGASFQRGLMPRSTSDQAAITGLLVAVNYGLVVTSQSAIQALAGVLAGADASPARFRRSAFAVEAAVLGIGLGLQRALPAYPGEPLARAAARSVGFRSVLGASTAMIGLTTTEAAVTVTGHETKALPIAPLAVAGAALAGAAYGLARRGLQASDELDEYGMAVESDVRIVAGRSAVAGAGVAVATFVAAYGERLFARGVAWPIARVLPEPVALIAGHAVSLGTLAGAGYLGIRKVLASADATGGAVEAAYSSRPDSPHVTGGPASLVDWNTLGREGRRFVNMAMTTAEIREATGRSRATAPVRAFIGVDSAATPADRADLALRELEALGGLERPLIVFYTPTGTGYVNYVALETVEHLTGGKCAQVAMQYSLRPSPMSIGRIGVGRTQNQAFLAALRVRLDAMPAKKRPRVVVFGESLGAQTGADTLFQGNREMEQFGVDRALFIGMPNATPAPNAWRVNKAGLDPEGLAVEIGTHAEWTALPEEQRARVRVVLLSQHDDPIVKFGLPLAVQKPDWLGDNRPAVVPQEMVWRPFGTFITTMIDAKNSMSVVPGTFVARGHDYRLQLAVFVRDVFRLEDPPGGMEGVERALRARELAWATRRVGSAQAEAAETAVRDQLEKWGVATDRVPPVVAVLPITEDPLAVTT